MQDSQERISIAVVTGLIVTDEGRFNGTIDILATDHAPRTREDKDVGWNGR